jgi:WD40 repeat protein
MFVLRGVEEPILALVFSPDATRLYASHSTASGIRVWNLTDRTSSALKAGRRTLFGPFVLHPGGRWAFCLRQGPRPQACVLDRQSGNAKEFNFVSVWNQVSVAPDGTRVATVGFASGPRGPGVYYALWGWKVTATGLPRDWETHLSANERAWSITFVGNDTLVTEDQLRTIGGRPVLQLTVRSADGTVRTTIGQPDPDLKSRYLLGSPDGRWLVAQQGLALRVWDSTDWEKPPLEIAGREAIGDASHTAAFHPSGRYLLRANDSTSVSAFDALTGEQVREWEWAAGRLRTVAVSPDGLLAAASGPGGAIVVWDLDL